MRNNNLHGTGVALITPFNEDFSIDFNSLKKMINYLINNSINYLVIIGTTAESVTLSIDEQNSIIDYVKKIVDNRIPIIVGVGGNNTFSILDRINSMNLSGVEAILSVCPYYNKPSQDGVYMHYAKIAEMSPVDIILYNVPSRTGLNIDPQTTIKLANSYKNIVAIKEASGDIAQCMSLISDSPSDFMIISGDDKMTFPLMSLGGSGVISVQAMVFPNIFSKMVNCLLDKDLNNAQRYHYQLLKSVDLFYIEGNPTGVKEALYSMGLCSSSQVRLPLVKMSRENAKKLNQSIQETINNKK